MNPCLYSYGGRGISLVELLVVVALIAILGAFALGTDGAVSVRNLVLNVAAFSPTRPG